MIALADPPTQPRLATAPGSEARPAETRGGVDERLQACLRLSRRLGTDSTLVQHGGGNTSVKSELVDAAGGRHQVLWVKATGADLATLDAAGMSPVALVAARRLLEREPLDDAIAAQELAHALLVPGAPAPSIETLTHATLPHRYVLHAHPDAVLAATSVAGGAPAARRLFGRRFPVLPWAFPGVALARAVRALWARHGDADVRGMVLLHHGVVTFADDPDAAWEAMLECVDRAATALPRSRPRPLATRGSSWGAGEIATLRRELSHLAGRPLVMTLDDSEAAFRFADHPALDALVQRGPLSACHVARTRRAAAVVRHSAATRSTLALFAADYRRHLRRLVGGRATTLLDAAPRLVVVPGSGVFAAGASAGDAQATSDIWRHSMPAMLAAEELGGYRSLPVRQLLDLERWLAEQELARREAPPPLAGHVALVTAAAGELAGVIIDALLARGAAVGGIDRMPTSAPGPYLGLAGEVADGAAIAGALDALARRFGGLDLLVADVGSPVGPGIDEPRVTEWALAGERAGSFGSLAAHLELFRRARPLLERSAAMATVVLVDSREWAGESGSLPPSTGPERTVLDRIAQLAVVELAPYGVRVHALHVDGDRAALIDAVSRAAAQRPGPLATAPAIPA